MDRGQLKPVPHFKFHFVGCSVVILCAGRAMYPLPLCWSHWLRKTWCSSHLIDSIAIKEGRTRKKVPSGTVWVLSIAYSLQTVNANAMWTVSTLSSWDITSGKWAAPAVTALKYLKSCWPCIRLCLRPAAAYERNPPFRLVSDAFLLQTAALQEYFSKQGRFRDLCNPEH